jgi:hypothetical protein
MAGARGTPRGSNAAASDGATLHRSRAALEAITLLAIGCSDDPVILPADLVIPVPDATHIDPRFVVIAPGEPVTFTVRITGDDGRPTGDYDLAWAPPLDAVSALPATPSTGVETVTVTMGEVPGLAIFGYRSSTAGGSRSTCGACRTPLRRAPSGSSGRPGPERPSGRWRPSGATKASTG